MHGFYLVILVFGRINVKQKPDRAHPIFCFGAGLPVFIIWEMKWTNIEKQEDNTLCDVINHKRLFIKELEPLNPRYVFSFAAIELRSPIFREDFAATHLKTTT